MTSTSMSVKRTRIVEFYQYSTQLAEFPFPTQRSPRFSLDWNALMHRFPEAEKALEYREGN